MNLARRLRRGLLAVIPSRIKSRLRRSYFRRESGGSPVPLEFLPVDGVLQVVVDHRLRMLILPETRADLELNCGDVEHSAEMRSFLQRAPQPGLLLDVGANDGFFSGLFCLSHPDNRAVGFEPSPILLPRLEKLRRLNALEDRFTVVDLAIGAEAGETELLVDEEGGYVQAAEYAGTARPSWKKRLLRTTTLDLECARLGIAPTMLKIDIEGYEWEALRGAEGVLRRFGPEIFLELHLNYLEQRGIEAEEVLGLLERNSYLFYSSAGKRMTLPQICGGWSPVVRLIARKAARPGG